jgi:hypothetical protein
MISSLTILKEAAYVIERFVLFEQFGIEKLFESGIYGDFTKDDLLMILKEAEKFAVNEVAPTLVQGDREGCTFKDGKVSVEFVW